MFGFECERKYTKNQYVKQILSGILFVILTLLIVSFAILRTLAGRTWFSIKD